MGLSVQVVKQALQNAGLSASAVDVLEMHGTGTPLGDPIELGAALAVVGPSGRQQPTGLSAMKSILGHCEPAAGAASMWHMIKRYPITASGQSGTQLHVICLICSA